MSALLAFRPFVPSDRWGYCDAQSFDDGSEPLIADIRVLVYGDEYEADAVLDREGLGIYAIDSVGSVLHVEFGIADAARAVALLRDVVDLVVLRAMPGAHVWTESPDDDLDDDVDVHPTSASLEGL